MTVLHSYQEYLIWVSNEYACDIFFPEEVETLIDEMKPMEYPCIVYFFPKQHAGEINRMMYISLNEIEKWYHMLLTSES